MALTSVATGDTVEASHVNQFKNALEGSTTVAYVLAAASATNITLKMSDAAGAQKVSFLDSASVEVASIDSDGNMTIAGSLTQSGSFTFPTSASPSPTTEGQAIWDTDDDRLAVGDGSATKIIYPGGRANIDADIDTDFTASSSADAWTTVFTLNITTTGGNIAFMFTFGMVVSNDSQTAQTRASLDSAASTVAGPTMAYPGTTVPYATNISGIFTGVAAGAHTIDLQINNKSASGTTNGIRAGGIAVEVA